MDVAPLAWHALEHEHRERTVDWFWAVAVAAVAGAVLAIIFGDILFAIVILVATYLLLHHAARTPQHIYFELNRRGIFIDQKIYPYRDIQSFWVEDDEHVRIPKLILMSKKIYHPYTIIPINEEEVTTEEVRIYLRPFLKEVEHHEPALQKVMEYLGF